MFSSTVQHKYLFPSLVAQIVRRAPQLVEVTCHENKSGETNPEYPASGRCSITVSREEEKLTLFPDITASDVAGCGAQTGQAVRNVPPEPSPSVSPVAILM